MSFPLDGNLSEEEGLRTSRNDRNHQKDVVILMVLLVTNHCNKIVARNLLTHSLTHSLTFKSLQEVSN